MIMERIKESIVVEGKDDESAVKKAVICDCIITHGYGIRESTWKRIQKAVETVGVIVLTDPDFAGETIRKRINERFPTCKHAFISREDARAGLDIGVENASPETIVEALSKVKTVNPLQEMIFSQADLIRDGLSGDSQSAEKRAIIGKILGIGTCNAKQFLNRLNHYGITREAYEGALKKVGKNG
jgi:ribonuclease M5